MTIHWKAVKQYFAVVLFVYPVSNFGTFLNFELGTARGERINVRMEIEALDTSIPIPAALISKSAWCSPE